MKKLRNTLLVILALSMMLSLFACKKNKEGDGETEKNVDPISFLDYSVVRPEKVSDKLLDGVSDMYMKLLSISGKDNSLKSDYLDNGADPDSAAKEILIGHTNRPETSEVLSQLANNEYAVAVVGNKIVITGIVDNLTPKALEYFVSSYLRDGTDGMIEGDLFHKGTADMAIIVDKGEPIYSLVRSNTEKSSGMVDMCYEVSDAISKASGVVLPMKTDRLTPGDSHDDNAFEILFGNVTYSQVDTIKKNVAPDGYNIEFIGNKIVIYAWNVEGISQAVSAFADLLTYGAYTDADGKTSLIIAKETITGTNSNAKYYQDIPFEVNGKRYDSVYDSYDNSMLLYWDGADETMLTSYASALEGMGYAKHQELDNTSIHSVTYCKNKASVHVYYLKRTNELRVSTQDNANLATNAYQYEKLCDVAVTQLNIYNDAETYVGMGYLIRLEDGSFVVIDGGQTPEHDSKLLYDTMVEQKPDGIDDIVISAWILTHGDGDHYGVLKHFIENYNDKIKVKQLIGNDPSDNICEATGKGKRTFKFSSVNGKFGGCVYTKAHTGQQFFLPGATITVLYTHEDWYPNISTGFNNTSTAFDMVVNGEGVKNPDKEGQTRFVWFGDAQAEMADCLEKMYFTDLKCDVMQIAHHGMGGGSYNLYRYCSPSIAFWPAGRQVLEYEDGIRLKEARHKYLIDSVDKMIYSCDGSYTILFTDIIDISGGHGSEGNDGEHTKFY